MFLCDEFLGGVERETALHIYHVLLKYNFFRPRVQNWRMDDLMLAKCMNDEKHLENQEICWSPYVQTIPNRRQ